MTSQTTSRTNIQEVADRIYRINTPVALPGGASFSFNQYLLAADEPLLFHTGPKKLFPYVSAAIARVLPVDSLRYVALSHVEADECGALGEFLTVAPHAEALCSQIAKMVSIDDIAPRPARGMSDGEVLDLGGLAVRWLDAPHVPHGWECGFVMELNTATLLCGDLFTQPGPGTMAVTTSDVLEPSEAFRAELDYFAHAPHTRVTIERLAAERPQLLACMHGSAWRGDGAAMLRALARSVTEQKAAAAA
jgi:flavorubredoxin